MNVPLRTRRDPVGDDRLVALDAPAGETIALVPTMGALHRGHLALIEHARTVADRVVVSIFVNPLQFDRPDDFEHYPRPIDADVAVCADNGVDAVYAPTAAVMYPAGFQTTVRIGALARVMEGASRPGHFDGVATVVTKLFTAVRPEMAVFGEKDFQQLAIVRRLSADLDLGVEVIGRPTVRETGRSRPVEPQHPARRGTSASCHRRTPRRSRPRSAAPPAVSGEPARSSTPHSGFSPTNR